MEYMTIKEFREKGYLQELNRQFLHPLGLAIEVSIDEKGNEILNGIWDYRSDPVGIIYDLENSDKERIELFNKKACYIQKERDKRSENRKKLFNSNHDVEPIEGKNIG